MFSINKTLITIYLILTKYKSHYICRTQSYKIYCVTSRCMCNISARENHEGSIKFDVYSFIAVLTCHVWLINPSGRCDKLTFDDLWIIALLIFDIIALQRVMARPRALRSRVSASAREYKSAWMQPA